MLGRFHRRRIVKGSKGKWVHGMQFPKLKYSGLCRILTCSGTWLWLASNFLLKPSAGVKLGPIDSCSIRTKNEEKPSNIRDLQ